MFPTRTGLMGGCRKASTSRLGGAPPKPLSLASSAPIFGNRSLAGSSIGDIRERQEMLEFCGKHGITANIEVTPMQQVNEAWQRLEKGDVKYRS